MGQRSYSRGASALLAAALLVLSACVPIGEDVAPDAGITPITDFGNPEDLALVVGSDWLVVSEFRHRNQKSAGRLVFYRVSDGERREPSLSLVSDGEVWGDEDCTRQLQEAAGFRPHGIDLVKRDGELRLLVVNHHFEHKETRRQERIDLFEVFLSDEEPSLKWRGCVLLPGNTRGNDVAALPDGEGFVVTNMGRSAWTAVRAAFGLDTGEVWAWGSDRWNCDPAEAAAPGGWCKVPGTESSLPNGVAISLDGHLYFSAYMDRRVFRIAGDGGQPLSSEVLTMTPDNLTWARDGRLLAAGSTVHPFRLWPCRKNLESGYCGAPFQVLSLDPADLKTCVVLSHDGKSAMGFPSVALDVGDALYLGTATGDRIARVEKPDDDLCAQD